MSLGNGHLPEGAQLATLDILRAANRKYVKAAVLSERVGRDVYVEIRTIRRVAYLQMLPTIPKDAGVETWPRDEDGFVKSLNAWIEGLPEADRHERKRQWQDVTTKIVRAGLVDPEPTDETIAYLGDDVDLIATEILVFSGLREQEAKTAAVEASPA